MMSRTCCLVFVAVLMTQTLAACSSSSPPESNLDTVTTDAGGDVSGDVSEEPEADIPEADVPEADTTEPDATEPDATEPDVPEPDAPAPQAIPEHLVPAIAGGTGSTPNYTLRFTLSQPIRLGAPSSTPEGTDE